VHNEEEKKKAGQKKNTKMARGTTYREMPLGSASPAMSLFQKALFSSMILRA
jgi:hypothetical protein